MTRPVNIIKLDNLRKKAGLPTCRILIDNHELPEHLSDALAIEQGRRVSWPGKNNLVVDTAALLASEHGSGRFAILNCTCGCGAMCAEFQDHIDVTHEGELVWKYKALRIENKTPDRVFHKPQYVKELGKLAPVNQSKC